MPLPHDRNTCLKLKASSVLNVEPGTAPTSGGRCGSQCHRYLPLFWSCELLQSLEWEVVWREESCHYLWMVWLYTWNIHEKTEEINIRDEGELRRAGDYKIMQQNEGLFCIQQEAISKRSRKYLFATATKKINDRGTLLIGSVWALP